MDNYENICVLTIYYSYVPIINNINKLLNEIFNISSKQSQKQLFMHYFSLVIYVLYQTVYWS